jgi:hypothetical protein
MVNSSVATAKDHDCMTVVHASLVSDFTRVSCQYLMVSATAAGSTGIPLCCGKMAG